MLEKSNEKKQEIFDRYEIVAIAVPGAALVAVIWYFFGRPGGGDITSISVGSLGAFTIAAFVAGHVIQSIANAAEDVWGERRHAPAMIPLDNVPLARVWIEHGLRKLGVDPCLECSFRGTRGKELRRIILSTIRAANRSRMLDNLKITVAVNRGICVVSLIAIVLVLEPWKAQTVAFERMLLSGAIVVAIVSFARAWRYTTQFEREIWVQFGELSRPKAET